MKKFEFMNNITRAFHKTGFQLKKHSPEILVVGGVIGMTASAVLACKATTKVSDILEDTKLKVEQVHTVLADETITTDVYSVDDSKKDLAIIYAQTGVKLAKLYGPALVLGAASITSILAGHNILHKRNAALATAYAAVDSSFKDYRNRVIERFGEELDHELKYNIKAKNIEQVTTDENGNEVTTTETVKAVNSEEISEYARFFDEACPGWDKSPEYNLAFLRNTQAYANRRLKERGILFLNEVYEMLGIPRSQAGQVIGWVYDENNPDNANHVDFGIYDLYKERNRAFVNGYERSILLDFNVDGNVYMLMK